ncbi:FecR domain-containing protein [Roseateles oligotrophus]|uniref:FecR domain-containing protein n=1 Tax=Roseateles oligotrophus TaxID=1769250 RepID=UPI0032B13B2E
MTTAPPSPGASTSGPDAAPSAELLQTAARWFVQLASGEATDADRQRWQAWRAADPRHEAAWQRAQAVTAPFAHIPPAQTGVSVAALEKQQGRRAARRQALKSLGGLAGLFCAGWFGWQGWRSSDASADALTAVGEQRDLLLADGSQLRLDTDTAIDVAFSASERLIHLRRGRVLITTAKPKGEGDGDQPPPPFWVETAEGRVRALGTRFAVRQDAGSTHVAVMEARVAIHAGALGHFGFAPTAEAVATDDAPILAAGEAAHFNRLGLLGRSAARSADSAWARGMLVADDLPLADFVAELARYRTSPLLCDPAVRALRISGTYPLTDTDKALAALARALPVRVVPARGNDPAGGLAIRPL